MAFSHDEKLDIGLRMLQLARRYHNLTGAELPCGPGTPLGAFWDALNDNQTQRVLDLTLHLAGVLESARYAAYEQICSESGLHPDDDNQDVWESVSDIELGEE